MMDSAFQLIIHYPVDKPYSETNCIIQWIVIYQVDSTIHLFNNRGLVSNANYNYIKILESDWSSVGLISAVIVQLHTSCACNCTGVRVMLE